MSIRPSLFSKIMLASVMMAIMTMSLFLPEQASAGDVIPGGGTTLVIPALSLTAPIIPLPLDRSIGTWNTSQLGSSVGHFEHTPWLGENGNVVLGGHATGDDGSPSIFYGLNTLRIGDIITVNEQGAVVSYVVRRIRTVAVTDLSVLYSTGRETLTLITCSGFNDETRTFEQRLVVIAERAG
jgi:LPXTG-site transpeptidase (sortase) family protein